MKLGQEQADVSSSFDYELEQWLLILEVILKGEQPLHVAIGRTTAILFIKQGNTEVSKATRLKTFDFRLP